MLEDLLRKSEPVIKYSKRCYNNGSLVMTNALGEYVDHKFQSLDKDTKKNYKDVYRSLSTYIHKPPAGTVHLKL